jgi:hypothetical protein
MHRLTAYGADAQKRPLRSRFRAQFMPGVRRLKEQGYDHRQYPISESIGP